jgi:hypothetical protein
MRKLIYQFVSLAIAIGTVCSGDVVHAQDSSTVIRVLAANGVEGIAGIVLLVNPGDTLKSQAFVTNTRGEAITRNLHCDICTVSAFDPQGLFFNRTTEFSSSRPSFSFVLHLRPVIDRFFDPQAVSIKLAIRDSKSDPLTQHDVAVRPTLTTLEDNRFAVQRTDAKGHLNVQLRTGEYTVAALNGETATEARFEIVNSGKKCSGGTVACIVWSSQSSRHNETAKLQLSLHEIEPPPQEFNHTGASEKP